jgi:DNA-binding MarR family transcriptional regulator
MRTKAPIEGVDLTGTHSCAAFSLRRASRVVSQLYDAGLQSVGLRATQFAILVAVGKTQPVSIGKLAQITVMDQTTMTRNLAPLARDGLIEIAARGAKREKLVRLTAKGERTLSRAVPVWRALQERFVSTLGAGKWREVRRELEMLTTAVTPDKRARRAGATRADRNAIRHR